MISQLKLFSKNKTNPKHINESILTYPHYLFVILYTVGLIFVICGIVGIVYLYTTFGLDPIQFSYQSHIGHFGIFYF